MNANEIELPPEIQELVDGCSDNCNVVENEALNLISSIDIPLFSVLRDVNSRNCYYILCRTSDWFGSKPTKEHCICLLMITDYISCSYNNTEFYNTFIKEKQHKFYESYFCKLSKEWVTLFHKISFSVFASLDQFNALKKNLSLALNRFSETFVYRTLLDDILRSCDDFEARLALYLLMPTLYSPINDDTTLKQKTNNDMDLSNKLSSISASMGCHSCDSKLIQKPATPKRSGSIDKFVRKSSSAINLQTKEPIKPPNVIVINDSPIKMIRSPSKLDNITNFMPSKSIKKPLEWSNPNSCIDGKRMKCDEDSVLSNPTEIPKLKTLNAFDILMRRKVPRNVS